MGVQSLLPDVSPVFPRGPAYNPYALRKESKEYAGCGKVFPRKEFGGRGRKKLRPRCKACHREWSRSWRRGDPSRRIRHLFKDASARSRKRGAESIPTSLRDTTASVVPLYCPICKRPLDYAGPLENGTGERQCMPSLDRLDPERGYVEGNIVIICFRCNRIKNSGTADDHERIADFMRRLS